MNLTYMAYQGQWNQAQVSHSPDVYADFLSIFRQARLARPVAQPYHVKVLGPSSTTSSRARRPRPRRIPRCRS